MPRGVYDRSKLKKNKAKAESTETAVSAAPKGKPGRKPGSKNKAKASVPQGLGVGVAQIARGDFHLISEVRANLAVLNAVATQFGSVPAVKTEIETHIGYLSRLSKAAFGEAEAEEIQAPANGASAQQYPTTVPMPPAPVTVPSIPAH